MKNDNDLILERLRGVPANKPSWRDKFDAGNPNVIQTNDNQAAMTDDSDKKQHEPDCDWHCDQYPPGMYMRSDCTKTPLDGRAAVSRSWPTTALVKPAVERRNAIV